MLLPRSYAMPAGGLAIMVLLAFGGKPSSQHFELTVLDVGQGLAVVVNHPSRQADHAGGHSPRHAKTHSPTFVFDTGAAFGERFNAGAHIIAPYLRRTGVEALAIMVSHGDADHKGGLAPLVQQFKPAWRDGYFRARIMAVKNLSTDMLEVVLKPERAWPTHAAGQHIALTIEINGRLTTRVFTVASGADTHRRTKCIRLVTKVKAQGALTPHLHSCLPNQWVNISAPMGEFIVPKVEKPLLMIAGGSGITPFIAMLDDAIEKAQLNNTPVHLLYFAKPNEHVLIDELSAFQKRCENFSYSILTKQKDGDLETAQELIAKYDTLAQGMDIALSHGDVAVQALSNIPDTPLRQILENIINFTINRDH